MAFYTYNRREPAVRRMKEWRRSWKLQLIETESNIA